MESNQEEVNIQTLLNQKLFSAYVVSSEVSVAVVVSNGKAAKDWYSKKLGMNSAEEGHWITVWPEGSNLKIHLCETGGNLEPGNTGIAFYTENIEEEVKRLKEKGVELTQDITDRGWGKFAIFSDPDGNLFWLIEGTP